MVFCPSFPNSLTLVCRKQHVATSVSSCGNHDIATQCLVKNFSPASRSIIHTTCIWFFEKSGGNVLWLTCFWWQRTYDITVHIMGLSLNKSCLEIKVTQIPSTTDCHLTTHPRSWPLHGRSFSSLVILLFVPESFAFRTLPHINEIKNLVANPRCCTTDV